MSVTLFSMRGCGQVWRDQRGQFALFLSVFFKTSCSYSSSTQNTLATLELHIFVSRLTHCARARHRIRRLAPFYLWTPSSARATEPGLRLLLLLLLPTPPLTHSPLMSRRRDVRVRDASGLFMCEKCIPANISIGMRITRRSELSRLDLLASISFKFRSSEWPDIYIRYLQVCCTLSPTLTPGLSPSA